MEDNIELEGELLIVVPDKKTVLQKAIASWEETQAHLKRRSNQSIRINRPVAAFAVLADMHLGSAGINYPKIIKDVQAIRDTEGVYVFLLGDIVDNFILKSFLHINLDRQITIPQEWVLLEICLSPIIDKILAVCAGNHDLWIEKLAGIDYFRDMLAQLNTKALYDPYELIFDLTVGKKTVRTKIRHKWRGSSQYNDTHGIEKDGKWNKGFELGIGAHIHRGALIRDTIINEEPALAVMAGTYKEEDEYKREHGFYGGTSQAAPLIVVDGVEKQVCGFRDLQAGLKYFSLLRDYYEQEQ